MPTDLIKAYTSSIINNFFGPEAPNAESNKLILKTVIYTLGTYITLCKIKNTVYDPIDTLTFKQRIKWKFFKFFKKTSYFKKNFQPEIDQSKADIVNSKNFQLYKADDRNNNNHTLDDDKMILSYSQSLDKQPKTPQEIIKELTILNQNYDVTNLQMKAGKFTGSVYSGENYIASMNSEIFKIFCWSNPLHTEMFRSIRKMEAEVTRQVINLYQGNLQQIGTLTSGGTESIFTAMIAYRNRYRSIYGEGINTPTPQLILPKTAHPAFNKACHYLGVKVILIEPNLKTWKMEAKTYKPYLKSKRTMAIVCSSPQYPHGVFDHVKDISDLALKYDIPVHMDSCLGSFLTPLVHEAGFKDLPLLNWETCPGLTSISCDTHKYGYTPKGTSVVMFKDPSYRFHSSYSLTTWPGGIYSTPTPAGSRPGVNVAMCWATMRSIGYDGYVNRCREIITLTRKLEKITRKIPGLVVIPTELQTLCFYSDKYNIFKFLAAMAEKGWHLQALQYPSAIHLGVTYTHVLRGQEFIDDFTKDMSQVGEMLNQVGDGTDLGKDACAFYGSTQEIPDRSIVEELSIEYWNAYYGNMK